MRWSAEEAVTHQACPPGMAHQLEVAGGLNRYGEPMFRLVWGYDRIVPMTGEWQEWEKLRGTLRDRLTGHAEHRDFLRLVSSVIETRQMPKYLPANCWHLEKWCPPEDYGSPEEWRNLGQEVIQGLTVDTAGEFPHRGEYELCYPLTDDLTSRGQPLELRESLIIDIVGMIRAGKERTSYAQRRAAIEQRERMKDEGFIRRTEDLIRNELRPYAGEKFVTVPEMNKK